MLHETLTAAELLAARGIDVEVVAMPWLDRVDPAWLAETFGDVREVLVVEDHAPVGALGDAAASLGSFPDPRRSMWWASRDGRRAARRPRRSATTGWTARRWPTASRSTLPGRAGA